MLTATLLAIACGGPNDNGAPDRSDEVDAADSSLNGAHPRDDTIDTEFSIHHSFPAVGRCRRSLGTGSVGVYRYQQTSDSPAEHNRSAERPLPH